MGFFRRRTQDWDVIDIGGDTVLSSPERGREMASQLADTLMMEQYSEPISKDIDDVLRLFAVDFVEDVEQLGGNGWEVMESLSLFGSIARAGYAFRCLEETLRSVEPRIPPLESHLAKLSKTKQPGDAILAASRMFAAEPGVLAASSGFGADLGEAVGAIVIKTMSGMKGGALPPVATDVHLRASWWFGFSTRCCEASLPAGQALAPPVAPKFGPA